ncbi:MAG: DUF3048 domain-containing protein [Clostridiales bacterium]|nr:DUF3048 domain-containing protein [Clostridiales bacterium]
MGKKQKAGFILGLIVLLMSVLGCKKKQTSEINGEPSNDLVQFEKTESTITVTPTKEPTPTEAPSHDGMARSLLTGEWVDEAVAKQRPFAVMLNNITFANPQSGIGDADILYEAIVEGGITRLMGIYGNIDPSSNTAKRLGSVRSARHYYVSFADEYDAIFVHFGQTSYAIKKMKKLGIDTINGMQGVGGNSFYRDNKIKKPHNAFTSLKGLQDAVEKGKYRTTYKENYEGHFAFYETDTDLKGDSAQKIKFKYSKVITPVLQYDGSTKEYLRFQYDGPHIDYNTKEQLHFKNIIVQFVKEWNIDKNGYQTMDIEDASGDGYYITNGVLTKITWKKNESTKTMRYYDADGKELTINPGKTFISIFPNNRVNDVIVE